MDHRGLGERIAAGVHDSAPAERRAAGNHPGGWRRQAASLATAVGSQRRSGTDSGQAGGPEGGGVGSL